MKHHRITFKNIAQMKEIDVDFGDLTVIVGPQASGKSIFLQLFKLLFDAGHINQTLRKTGFHWQGDAEKYFSLYLGEGMGNIFRMGWFDRFQWTGIGSGFPVKSTLS